MPVLALSAAPVREWSNRASRTVFSVSSRTEAPLYERHCAYLI